MRALGNATTTPRSPNDIAMAAIRARHLLQNPHVLRQGDLPRAVSDFFAGDAHPDLAAVAQWAREQGELDLLPFLVELGYCDKAAAPETIHPGNIDDLIDALRTSDTDVVELSLSLSGHLATGCLHKLTTLLKLVDELPALASLQVQLVDCHPPSAEMRIALAGSTACLTLAGNTVRPLIVGDLVLTDSNEQSLLNAFQTETNRADPANRIRFDVLGMVAQKQGHEALLRALVQLSPGLTVTQYGVPLPAEQKLLDTCGCGIALVLWVTLEAVPTTLATLRDTPTRWASINMRVDHGVLPADASALAQAAIRCASLTLAEKRFSPTLRFASQSTSFILEPRFLLGDTSALPQEQVILEIYAASGPQIVLDLASLVTELRPRYLRLLCDRPASARTLCETLAQSTAAPVLEDLALRCSGIDPSIDMSKVMLEIVSMFKHMRMIVISATTQLDTASKEALIAVGNESLFLDSIRFISEIPNLKDPTTDIVFIPAMRLHQGPFQRTYHAAATARFFAVLGLPWDAGAHIAEMGVMDLRTQQALVCVSTATATTAADRRRDLQATLVAEALVDGAFTPGVLRDMLVSSTGACDRALVSAIQQRLQAARDEAALAILNEAVPQ